MNLSLRNLAIAGTLMVSGAVMAQAPFAVTEVWKTKDVPTAANPYRDGTAFNGNVYLLDKTNGKVVKVGAEGVETLDLDAAGCNAITSDEAGNIILKIGGFGAAADLSNKYRIFPADGSASFELTVGNGSDGFVAGRADELGRAVGNIMSDEGGVFYATANGSKKVRTVCIVNGEEATDYTEYVNDKDPSAAANTMSMAQPAFNTMEEFYAMYDELGDNFYNATFYYRSDASYNVEKFDVDQNKFVTYTRGAGTKLQHGWDIFEINGVKYQLHPGTGSANWVPSWCITELGSSEILYEEANADFGNPTNGNGSMLLARVVDENTVQVYQAYFGGGAMTGCGMWELKFEGGNPAASLYMVGNINGWSTSEPVVINAENGVYTYTFEDHYAPEFKLSTTYGADWPAFNEGGFSIANMNIKEAGTWDLEKNADPANFTLVKGCWTIKVDLENMKFTVEGTADAFEAPELYYRGQVRGEDHWNTMQYKFDLKPELSEKGEYVYELVIEGGLKANDEFKISDDNWGVQFSTYPTEVKIGETKDMHHKWNSNSKVAADVAPHAKLTFYMNPDYTAKDSYLLLTSSTSGVDNIAADTDDAAPVYYNLQGVRVEKPANGLYIVKKGGKVSKELVR